ncbi:Uncharacterised protein [Vibrio cholerae]|nr:Uncharacterised protein [Vibrio cholerae]
MPFIPGPETLTIVRLLRVVMPLIASLSSPVSWPIKVPAPCGLKLFLIKQGI